ncbi:MAG: hypothetical protein KDE22_09030 [Rhodobacterales bacterium]|nr:hypothetical protein [Rhodobacterales bacterium]
MFSDNTLTPKEAIRLCALGTLAQQPMHYSGLANAVRHFASRVMGPSLDLMGTSIELLRYEGLVEPVDGKGMEDDALLQVTDSGMAELRSLMVANVRAAATELNKLILALKFRFLHLLDPADQGAQAEQMVEVCENELARLEDLRQHHAEDPGHLLAWLDHDIGLLETRLAWLQDFRDRVSGPAA